MGQSQKDPFSPHFSQCNYVKWGGCLSPTHFKLYVVLRQCKIHKNYLIGKMIETIRFWQVGSHLGWEQMDRQPERGFLDQNLISLSTGSSDLPV